jgi:predicted alpha/beta superfamily hydrolase
MEQKIDLYELDSRPVAAYFPQGAGQALPKQLLPVIFMLSGPEPALELSAALKIAGKAVAGGSCPPFATVAVGSAQWNIDYSPWPAPAVLAQDSPFEGGARDMLGWVTDTVLPWAEEQCPAKSRSLMGYSLAGLAALYAMYITDAFDACASCSGSLWFDGWLPFLRENNLRRPSRIYLSLGRSEEKTRNPRMSVIGDATREAASIFENDPQVQETALVWHDGGHFLKIPERTADALVWLSKTSH